MKGEISTTHRRVRKQHFPQEGEEGSTTKKEREKSSTTQTEEERCPANPSFSTLLRTSQTTRKGRRRDNGERETTHKSWRGGGVG